MWAVYPRHLKSNVTEKIPQHFFKQKQQQQQKKTTHKNHICNPSYLGGRDQKDQSLKSSWANNLQDPISKVPNPKKG
jgi:hypothetical protein